MQYRPIKIMVSDKSTYAVGLIDTGADETIISTRIAQELQCSYDGEFIASSASGHEFEGEYTCLSSIKEKWSGKEVSDFRVAVTDAPFSDDEGIEIIIGVDFLQETGYILAFTNR